MNLKKKCRKKCRSLIRRVAMEEPFNHDPARRETVVWPRGSLDSGGKRLKPKGRRASVE